MPLNPPLSHHYQSRTEAETDAGKERPQQGNRGGRQADGEGARGSRWGVARSLSEKQSPQRRHGSSVGHALDFPQSSPCLLLHGYKTDMDARDCPVQTGLSKDSPKYSPQKCTHDIHHLWEVEPCSPTLTKKSIYCHPNLWCL